ncbi:hypothetical protein B1748_23690 [Paenibacillus sp. MY03]|uniref:hypothetical protein n=1 Tax=Paenibacillus sp. MY03 TaxID=302980 RepID=UPI000B3C8CC2|nr:hypothetical protein [Paenibacillus sp. MY03]OUS73012.1 hypothetical protein B1748_23690 [Paenibacillus sp. MY03]
MDNQKIQEIIAHRKGQLSKADPEKHHHARYFVIPTPELQLLVDTLEQQQREIERLRTALEQAQRHMSREQFMSAETVVDEALARKEVSTDVQDDTERV